MLVPVIQNRQHPEAENMPLRVAAQSLASEFGWRLQRSSLIASEHSERLLFATYTLAHQIPGIQFEVCGINYRDDGKLMEGDGVFRMDLLEDDLEDPERARRSVALGGKVMEQLGRLSADYTLYGLKGKFDVDMRRRIIFEIVFSWGQLSDLPDSATSEDLFHAYHPILNVINKSIDLATRRQR